MAVVREVHDQRAAAIERSKRLLQLSDNTPEKSTVTENSDVKSAPDSKPYRV